MTSFYVYTGLRNPPGQIARSPLTGRSNSKERSHSKGRCNPAPEQNTLRYVQICFNKAFLPAHRRDC
ncbi:hypothetical protein Y032_0149g2689 [Ancylostoma ceylanicum]|nr:hypothetical protein Y032_0149g2689 [Ancylostoma ceylanicum]